MFQKNVLPHVSKSTFLTFTFGFFWENLGNVSEEHGEHFHQDIQTMGKRNQRGWDCAMMGDYMWSLIRVTDIIHKRKGRSSKHF